MKTGGLNVLLVFPDQWRPDWTRANPAVPLVMPNLKQLMAEGTHFTHAVTSSPVSRPSSKNLPTPRLSLLLSRPTPSRA